jgi:hypothetical protein
VTDMCCYHKPPLCVKVGLSRCASCRLRLVNLDQPVIVNIFLGGKFEFAFPKMGRESGRESGRERVRRPAARAARPGRR